MLPRIGLGCAPLGNLFRHVSDDDARQTVDAAWECGIRYFDTAPLYGFGLSEQRVGSGLNGRPREEFMVSTKVGRVLVDAASAPSENHPFATESQVRPRFDFSRDGVRRSLESSLSRLGLDWVDVAFVHDPDDHLGEALDTAFPALAELKAEGLVRNVGCGMNDANLLASVVRRADLDAVLIAGRYTLLDQSADRELLPLCLDRGIHVVAGGVFNSGVLAVADARASTFDYGPVPEPVQDQVELLRRRATQIGIELPTAALQFPLGHEAVGSVLFGARTATEVRANVGALADSISSEDWAYLRGGGRSGDGCAER